ncbi:phospholipase A2 [Fusarium oxysporum f. sp. conglutinans race 2 54008]|uniref:Lysophospholipase n=1 Tax=Fusarium oxysporum f. sp. conglutinans race 2 54008 TaxID=1089457 RepID=X0GU21_FUSOX|nr:phospholipase A2 [Fusarium oxysporum f. sp. conglutinans race 2 54008]
MASAAFQHSCIATAEVLPFVEPQGAPNAPDGYAPGQVSCPETRPAIRQANNLSNDETTWLEQRDKNTVSALRYILKRFNIGNIDTDSYLDGIVSDGDAPPRIGIAISGGGYRAMMNGAGAIAAFDNRTTNSGTKGQLGGILQATTYLSGLSGGSWTVGSLYTQNFTSVESIISAKSGFLSTLWQFDDSIIEGPADLTGPRYYRQLYQDLNDKVDAGFNKSITDYWGRALSHQLVNASDGGPAYTFSSIANDTNFADAQTPMPIIVAIERTTGQVQIATNSTIVEFNPWEMGSYDPGLSAFAPLKYVSSSFDNGTLKRGSHCIAGVDNVVFVMGTSASLFNQAFLQIDKANNVPDFLLKAINNTYNSKNNSNANTTILTLVDGGEDLQNIPLHPLLLSERKVDVIFAVDGSADTQTRWPNGTALVATYQRSKEGTSPQNNNFPKVPDQNTFVNLGLNKQPIFFGCGNSSGPLIVYLPNAPYTTQFNFTTFDLEYGDTERNEILQNGYNVATMGNGTVDENWPACIGCAILERSFIRTKTALPSKCEDCFKRFCWNGTTNDTVPGTYEPEKIIESGVGHVALFMGVVGVALSLIFVFFYMS